MKCVVGSLLNSNVYVPIIAVTGSVAAIGIIAWPVAIVLQKLGIIGGALASGGGTQGIIGSAPFASKLLHMRIPQHDL
jgi:hypothetical protein